MLFLIEVASVQQSAFLWMYDTWIFFFPQLLVPDGLSVDWVHNNVYWTDKEHHSVSVSTSDGIHAKTLIKRSKTYFPRAIEVDPANG